MNQHRSWLDPNRRFRRRSVKCAFCHRKLVAGYRVVAGKPRCFWCDKRLTGG